MTLYVKEKLEPMREAYGHLAAGAEEHSKTLLFRLLNMVKQSISYRIVLAGRNQRDSYDAKIYDCYCHVMAYYKEATNLCKLHGDKIESVGVKNILDGLHAVLCSRLAATGDDTIYENPIVTERQEIVMTSIQLFAKQYDALMRKFHDECFNNVLSTSLKQFLKALNTNQPIQATDLLTKELNDHCGKDFYDLYQNSVKHCLANLRDVSTRHIMMSYYELLGYEKEILTSIITIQIQALEQQIPKGSPDIEIVEAILKPLREGYQFLGKDVLEIMNHLKEMESSKLYETFDDYQVFAEKLREQASHLHVEHFDIKESWETFAALAKGALAERLKQRYRSYNPYLFLYEAQKLVCVQIMMADDMMHVFSQIWQHYKDHEKELMATESTGIAAGIAETIGIKLESIEENKNDFSHTCSKIIVHAKQTNELPNDEDKANLLALAFSVFIEEAPLHTGDWATLLDSSVNTQQMLELTKQWEQWRQQLQTQIQSKVKSFKRDILLYEASTFEEIIMYSVSRLKEIRHNTVADYVRLIENSSADLNDILKKHNIIAISPKPHDPFNGKEHDILMAEHNSAFQKGEVIKLMNSGYKQDDEVIIRANVIAAK